MVLACGEHNVGLVVLGSLVVVAVLHFEVDGQALLSADFLGVLVHGNTDRGAVGVGILPDENADVQLGLAVGSSLGSGVLDCVGLVVSLSGSRGVGGLGGAGGHGQNHHHCKQQSDDLFHCVIPPKVMLKRKVPFVIVFYHVGNERTSKKRFQSREKHL